MSGTFRQAIDDVQASVQALSDAGVLVLSPSDPRIVDRFGDFVFVASDRVRHLKTVQDRHLAAIRASDFVWLVAPDGYVGLSAAMEIQCAAEHDVPVYCTEVPVDLTVRQRVITVDSICAAIERHGRPRPVDPAESLLLNPERGLQLAHDDLVIAQAGLLGRPRVEQTDDAVGALERLRRRIILP